MLGTPEKCPNCGQVLRTVQETIEPEAASDQTEPAAIYEQPVHSEPVEAKMDKKVMWSLIFILAPISSAVLFGLTFLTSGIKSLQQVVSIIAGILSFLSFFLVPAALILGILGLKSIKRSKGASTGRGIAITSIVLASLFLLSGPVGVGVVVKYRDFFMAKAMSSVSLVIEQGIKTTERDNREAEIKNSFGTFFPETLDNASTGSESSQENPFFTEVMKPNGYPAPGWKKTDDINTYLSTIDSTVYIYNPKDGTFSKVVK
jgi:hypothetical protein